MYLTILEVIKTEDFKSKNLVIILKHFPCLVFCSQLASIWTLRANWFWLGDWSSFHVVSRFNEVYFLRKLGIVTV